MRVLRPRYAVLGIAAAAVVLAAMLGSTSVGRPNSCARCHADLVKATEQSAHANVDCYSCHADSSGPIGRTAHDITTMYPRAILGTKLTRPAKQISADRCLACHEDILNGVVSGTRLRIKHARCAKGPSCDPCHSTTAHGDQTRWKTTPSMDECVSCHSNRNVNVTCRTCHLTDAAKEDHVKGAWHVTHGPNWRKTHGMGDIKSCRTCHPEGYCARCHGIDLPHPATFGDTHGKDAMKRPSSCTVCHADKKMCTDCHGMEMPHPDGFLKSHSKTAGTEDNPACMRCHIEGDCSNCHGFHAHPGAAKGVPAPWPLTNESLRPGGSD